MVKTNVTKEDLVSIFGKFIKYTGDKRNAILEMSKQQLGE